MTLTMTESEIIARVENGVGRITLNRPKAIHALNRAMCEAMIAALLDWRDDAAVRSVLIDHAGERGFCAGGDIRMIAESSAGDRVEARAFFMAEYRLNALMFGYPKPITAIVDGIVMGGGVGISEPADVRIATERTTYAMPETGIGLYPEVGGGWFLPRLPGQTGVWIGLTGARLKAADTVALGIHTHFTPSEGVEALKADLLAEGADPAAVAARHAKDAGPAPLAAHREAIVGATGDAEDQIPDLAESQAAPYPRGGQGRLFRRQHGRRIRRQRPDRRDPRLPGRRAGRDRGQGQCAEMVPGGPVGRYGRGAGRLVRAPGRQRKMDAAGLTASPLSRG